MATAGVPFDFGSFRSSFEQVSRQSLLNLTDLPLDVKRHLSNVYSLLCAVVATAAAGIACDIYFRIGGTVTHLGALFTVMWLGATPATKSNQRSRSAVLAATAFFQGCSAGQIVNLGLELNPMIVLSALAGTSVCFACFSLAALVSKRRSFLYLGGMLSSAATVLLGLHMAAMFGMALPAGLSLYLGLAIFMGYVVFDTQVIVERAIQGDRDHVRHALDLFQDVFAIFIRLVIIMSRSEMEQRRRREQQQRRREK